MTERWVPVIGVKIKIVISIFLGESRELFSREALLFIVVEVTPTFTGHVMIVGEIWGDSGRDSLFQLPTKPN